MGALQAVTDLVPESLLTQITGHYFANLSVLGLHAATSDDNNTSNTNAATKTSIAAAQDNEASTLAALRQLGVRPFTAHHLVQLLQTGMHALVDRPCTDDNKAAPGSVVAWGHQCECAWRVLALLEQLLTVPSPWAIAFGTMHGSANTRGLIGQLSQATLLPLTNGTWAAASPTLVVTPQLHDLTQTADDLYDESIAENGTETGTAVNGGSNDNTSKGAGATEGVRAGVGKAEPGAVVRSSWAGLGSDTGVGGVGGRILQALPVVDIDGE